MRLLFLAAFLLLPLSARAAPPEGRSIPVLAPVELSESKSSDGTPVLRLTFPQLAPDSGLPPLTVEDAREVVAAFEERFRASKSKSKRPRLAALVPGVGVFATTVIVPTDNELEELERRVVDDFVGTFGEPPPTHPLPESLTQARWFKALSMSLLAYGMAWLAPEPFISKGAAGAATVALLMRYTYTEILTTMKAFLTLYKEAQAAPDDKALEPVSRKFAEAMSGVGLRVIVTLAGAKLSRSLPEVPPGGPWERIARPRLEFAGNGSVANTMRQFFSRALPGPAALSSSAPAMTASVVGARLFATERSVVFMAVLANTTEAAKTAAARAARTTGACSDKKRPSYEEHHIATNKNDKSERTGGPWTPVFEELFAEAGMSLDDKANKIYLLNHKGPHPEEYHKAVYSRLEDALKTCQTRDGCRAAFEDALDRIAAELCTPGSRLNQLATRRR